MKWTAQLPSFIITKYHQNGQPQNVYVGDLRLQILPPISFLHLDRHTFISHCQIWDA